jgi:hypothetical protein
MSKDFSEYKIVDSNVGRLRWEVLNPNGVVVAIFPTKLQAEQSAHAVMSMSKRLIQKV